MQNNNYWELEDKLVAKYGAEAVTDALAQLEEDYGTNGLDAYRSGEFDMLLNYFDNN